MSLSRILETRDPQTYYHSFRVSRYALCLAIALGWPDEQQRVLEAGAWLHDIGKLGVPETILRKAGPLTPAEYQVVQTHVAHGIYILQGVTPLTPFLPYVAYHHEWYDGRGYPFGLIGTDIPIEGRLLTVADAFDALTSPRSYRTATAPDEALGILRGAAGSQFDPQIIAVVDSAGLPDAADEVRTWGSEDWH